MTMIVILYYMHALREIHNSCVILGVSRFTMCFPFAGLQRCFPRMYQYLHCHWRHYRPRRPYLLCADSICQYLHLLFSLAPHTIMFYVKFIEEFTRRKIEEFQIQKIHSATCVRSPTSKESAGTCPDRLTARNPDITESCARVIRVNEKTMSFSIFKPSLARDTQLVLYSNDVIMRSSLLVTRRSCGWLSNPHNWWK